MLVNMYPGVHGRGTDLGSASPELQQQRETRGKDAEPFIESAFGDTLQKSVSSALWLSGEGVVKRAKPSESRGGEGPWEF